MNVLHITAYLDIREKMGPNSLQQTRKAPGRFPARGVEVVLVKKKEKVDTMFLSTFSVLVKPGARSMIF